MTGVLPFAGIDEARPYPATGLTTARWITEVPTELVAFCDLHLTQKGVRIRPLFGVLDFDEAACADRVPHVVAWDGRLYLEDGHHRVVRAALHRFWEMTMRVYRRPE